MKSGFDQYEPSSKGAGRDLDCRQDLLRVGYAKAFAWISAVLAVVELRTTARWRVAQVAPVTREDHAGDNLIRVDQLGRKDTAPPRFLVQFL